MDKAKQKCSALGGALVEPVSYTEGNAVASLMKEAHWIGLSDKIAESR